MHTYFPVVEEVGPFGPAFLCLMFAYAEFERRVGELQKVITGKLGFSEKNHWGAQERPKRMRKLIRANAKRIPVPPAHVAQIVKVLKQAISPSDLRNLLVHGDWWILHADGQIITVRRRDGPTHWARCEATLVHPHMLRHSTGFKGSNDGHDTRSLAHYLGHRNLQSPARYTELAPDRFAKFWQD